MPKTRPSRGRRTGLSVPMCPNEPGASTGTLRKMNKPPRRSAAKRRRQSRENTRSIARKQPFMVVQSLSRLFAWRSPVYLLSLSAPGAVFASFTRFTGRSAILGVLEPCSSLLPGNHAFHPSLSAWLAETKAQAWLAHSKRKPSSAIPVTPCRRLLPCATLRVPSRVPRRRPASRTPHRAKSCGRS